MGMYLNTMVPFENYKTIANMRFFVDKTLLIDEVIQCMKDTQNYICITRPRRFGKTVMANMLGAFFCKSDNSTVIFDKLAIANSENYSNHLNQHNLIYIDFSEVPRDCHSYEQYIERIQNGINRDLAENYTDLNINLSDSVWDVLTEIFLKTKDRFIFIIDEWDAVFHMPFISEKQQRSYLLFLKSLLKSKAYVELAYMTGILPIAKYSDGSELNMFSEYNMATRKKFSEYFGFLDYEVDQIFAVYLATTKQPQIERNDLCVWYDGYHTAAGDRMYNPRSVINALTDNQLANYWTSSGIYDSIFGYIKDNVADVQNDLILMFAGDKVQADMQEYAATAMTLETRDEIYSAMVVYGLLTYEDGYVSIPNKEQVIFLLSALDTIKKAKSIAVRLKY